MVSYQAPFLFRLGKVLFQLATIILTMSKTSIFVWQYYIFSKNATFQYRPGLRKEVICDHDPLFYLLNTCTLSGADQSSDLMNAVILSLISGEKKEWCRFMYGFYRFCLRVYLACKNAISSLIFRCEWWKLHVRFMQSYSEQLRNVFVS